MIKTKRKMAAYLAVIMALWAVMLFIMPQNVRAENYDAEYDISQNSVTIDSAGTYRIYGTTASNTITVSSGISANITLDGVNIDISAINYSCAFMIADNSTGNVTITLADGSTNTLKSGFCCAALQKSGSGSGIGTLTVKGTGSLTAAGGDYAAGIGGDDSGDGTNITISGGTVSAYGGRYGAGIGGGRNGSGTNITISGGSVTATGDVGGAGIGGGGNDSSSNGSGTNITISGGTVTATGDDGGAGIGGGSSGNCSDITISGGAVDAAGGSYGAGIGGGWGADGSDITISGGTVTATGGDGGAGIGGGTNITISSGTVTATGGDGGAGIGGGSNGSGSDITISGGSVKAVAGEEANTIGGGLDNDAVTPVNANSQNVYLLEIANPDSKDVYIDSVKYTPVNHKALDSSDTTLYAYLPADRHTVKVGDTEKTYDIKPYVGELDITADSGELDFGTDYTYENGVLTVNTSKAVTIKNAEGITTAADTIVVADGISANITLDGVNIDVSATYDACAFMIADNSTGNVTITLADGSTNTLKSGENRAALQKNGSGSGIGTLTVKGTGSLTAAGGYYAAGIGGGDNGDGTNITISGGTVTATGGAYGSGIGGGDSGDGTNITISGGTVSAYGGRYGAGIGGGSNGSGSDISINNGTVTATGDNGGAGIGGGDNGDGTNITISGGSVTATGDDGGAGIGGGSNGSGTNITISGGSVTATGGTNGSGIGGGCYGDGTNITINNGTVTAAGIEYGAGIGGGGGFSGSDITINNGTVTATGGQYGAGIGGGGGSGNGSDITINNGTVTATGGQYGAGIGGGSNGSGTNITISSGTVTATGGYGCAGIGGGYCSYGTNITISGGSVKAVAGEEANTIGGGLYNDAVTPVNANSQDVYLLEIANPDSKDVYIDGVKYTPVNHKALDSSDTTLYAYLTAGKHVVKVGDTEKTYDIKPYVGELDITADSGELDFGTDYTYENGVLTVNTSKAVTIKNTEGITTATDTIVVADGVSANITLDGVNIDVSATNYSCAFMIADNSTGNVTITLADGSTNTLKSGYSCAALQKNGSGSGIGTLTVKGTGSLTAAGGYGGAGIGGGYYRDGTNITINNGTVTAAGGDNGAGIGGGRNGSGSDITISGGSVKVLAGEEANTLGGGLDYDAVTPVNANSQNVYLLEIANPDSKDVYIDGVKYTPVNHKALDSSDTTLYAYLTAGRHTVKVGDSESNYNIIPEAGDLDITADSGELYFGTDYTYENGVLTVNTSKAVTIKNAAGITTTTDTIVVADGISANITLDDVNIDVSATYGACAFMITDNSTGNVTITLADGSTNTLKSGETRAALQKNGSGSGIGTLTVKGTGSLTAAGGYGGAGIGGGYDDSGTNITISGGTVSATGGDYAAGIGGGADGGGTNITISGGTVSAYGGYSGSGIGGGWSGDGSYITISGGTVTAEGYFSGAGIGGGSNGNCSDITISGGAVSAEGYYGGAGIGGGSSGNCSDITISGGAVDAAGGSYGAGIGGGWGADGSDITISGGTVTAEGYYGACIGGGAGGSGSDITISGGSVKTIADDNANAIGGGLDNDAVTPVNANGENVYLHEIDNPDSKDVYIDGVKYTPVNHKALDSDDTTLYVYLTDGEHDISLGEPIIDDGNTDWTYDHTGHWHEHNGTIYDFANHTCNSGDKIANGKIRYTCSVCGYSFAVSVDMSVSDSPSYINPSYSSGITFDKLNADYKISGSTLTLSWNKINSAGKYVVYEYKNGAYTIVKTTSRTSTSFNDYVSGNKYRYLIRYSINGRMSPIAYSAYVTVNGSSKPAVTAAATANAVRLSWNDIEGAEKYAVYRYADGRVKKIGETENTSVTVRGLSSDTEYKFIVRAYIDGKWTAMKKSDIVTITTK